MGSLSIDFDHLKRHVDKEILQSTVLGNQLLEELFRFLYLLADNSDEMVKISLSEVVDRGFRCLMLDPVLYFRVCDVILTLQGKSSTDKPIRVLPYDATGRGESPEITTKAIHMKALARYKQIFGADPPLVLWANCYAEKEKVGDQRSSLDAQRELVDKANLVDQEEKRASEPSPLLVPILPSLPSPPPVRPYLRIVDFFNTHHNIPITPSTRFCDVIAEIAEVQSVPVQRTQLVYEGLLLRESILRYSMKMNGGDVIVCNYATTARTIKTRDATNKITTLQTVFTSYAATIEKVSSNYTFELEGWKLDLYITLHSWIHKEGERYQLPLGTRA